MTERRRRVPWLSYGTIGQMATRFRQRVECSSQVCPIEEIVELKLGLDIVPTPNLYGLIDTSGLLAGDLSGIWVDEYCWTHLESKCRFTLAHEVGHLEMHSDLWNELNFTSVAQWREVIESLLSDEEHWNLETQADMFAGVVLVSSEHLAREFHSEAKVVAEGLAESVSDSDVDPQTVFQVGLKVVCSRIAPRFEVSEPVIDARLHYEGLKGTLAKMILPADTEVDTRKRIMDIE